MGEWAIVSVSRKQKLNKKSITEADLVGANNVPSPILSTKLFLEAQVYNVEQNILYKEKKITILIQ